MNDQATASAALEILARETGRPLAPHWDAELAGRGIAGDARAIDAICAALGWPLPQTLEGRPRADQFPLLVHDAQHGWAVARQWDSEGTLRLAGAGAGTLAWSADQTFLHMTLPDPVGDTDAPRAIDIFARAIMRRRQPLIMAGVATVFANLLALATSLYSMQLYDRVIPLGSLDTLLVLTVGVLFALTLDLTLRGLRAALIEREAVDIDAETSEIFFARAQAIRLDIRPPQVGTLAAQLRGQEQIRQVLSSSSLFMLADLPFAIFFIVVIWGIGGPLALVPLISLPIAIGIALLLARLTRSGADKAQVSGNQKNGMLVEALDAAETIKANRGAWLMLGRWNRLVREVHGHDLKIRRISSVSQAVFSTLQQTAYVAMMGWGAYLVANGELTAGALLACSIIGGRINGPLVAQLPSLILQWGYARSSLKALDGILALPLDHATSGRALRPDAMGGPLTVSKAAFGYPGSRQALEIEALAIAPGERVAIVGGVGSGKSTLLKVLSGLYSPQAGSVKIGGLDAGQVAEDVIRRHVGYLPQDARLVNGTLRDNLVMGITDPGDDALLRVAQATRLGPLIAGHEQGLSLPITEGGRGLSGGQRSLVLLNRLLHARPRIWLLDEPSAALDQASETAVFAALDEALRADDILIVVTHKPQLLNRFARIIVMAEGRVARDGPARSVLEELMPRPGPAPARKDGAPVSARVSGAQAARIVRGEN